MRLTLRPLGKVDSRVLAHLRENLTEFGRVTIAPSVPLPFEALEKERGQYRATRLFEACESDSEDRVLGVTEADLFEGELRSVFGYAQIGGKVAIISLARLQGAQRRRTLLPRTAERRRRKFLERCVKEAVHELGHTLGLTHDDRDPECVMHYSLKLADTDRKGRAFCRSCASRADLTLKRLGT